MKRQVIFLTLACLLVGLSIFNPVEAKKWRVNNNTGVDADFTNPQEANDYGSVLSGDTLMIEGSSVNYGDVDFSKFLYIIGTGYFLSANPETQANLSPAMFENVDFEQGSDSSLIMGIEITNSFQIYTDNITVKRCYLNSASLEIETNSSNIFVLQNYIHDNYDGIEIADGCSNIIIQNNIIRIDYDNSNSYNAIYMSSGTSTATITQNIFDGSLNVRNSVLTNNIMFDGILNGSGNCSFNKNICDNTAFPSDSNLTGTPETDVFVMSGSTDGQFKLLEASSPAIGYGVDGYDCGAFGGIDPYVLSGLPPVPTIYYFNAPSTGSTLEGLPVTIKVKSRK